MIELFGLSLVQKKKEAMIMIGVRCVVRVQSQMSSFREYFFLAFDR